MKDRRILHEQARLHAADRTILEHLLSEQPDYVPLVANRLGMNLSYVETRCDFLLELGLLETVTNEVVYAVTDRGEAFLAGELDLTNPTEGE